MGVLAEYLKTEAGHIRTERQFRKDAVQEWNESLKRLYSTLTGWVQVADGGLGLIGGRVEQYRTEEPKLGPYLCHKLVVLWGDELSGGGIPVADVIPRARFVAATLKPVGREPRAADGMVEIRASRITTHYLFRWANPDEWFICTHAEWQSREFGAVHPLTAEAFEAAVLGAVQ